MTAPVCVRQRIRQLDRQGLSHREISRKLGVSRTTVVKYANHGDYSPKPLGSGHAGRSLVDAGYSAVVDGWPAADLRMPVKQRHTATRVYERLVAECGFTGSYSSVQRWVKRWRREHRMESDGFAELEWAPGSMQVDFGQARLFSLFCAHYGFGPRFRDPCSGHGKGSVENAVGFVRRNLMVPMPSAESFQTLTRVWLDECERIAGSDHYRHDVPVIELFEAEKDHMLPLPGVRFDPCDWRSVKADKTGAVTIDANRYPAGPKWRSMRLQAGVRVFEIELRGPDGETITTLERIWGHSACPGRPWRTPRPAGSASWPTCSGRKTRAGPDPNGGGCPDSYETRSVISDSNLESGRWGDVFGDGDMAAAVIDRIVHHGGILRFHGESYRNEHSLMK